MRLRISYSEHRDENMQRSYKASATVREDDGGPLRDVAHLLDMNLETLARRWWLIQGKCLSDDANADLLTDDSGWKAAKVSDLVRGTYTAQSFDAVTVVAIVERLKRACVMFYHCFFYEQFLMDATKLDPEVIHLSLNPNQPQPSGLPLPGLPQRMLDRIDR